MFLTKFIGLSRAAPNVLNLTNIFQKCLISSTPAFRNQLTTPQSQEIVKSTDKRDPVKNINQQITADSTGRLFAIVQVAGKQFKITTGDTILIEGFFQPTNGNQIKLEKILLCGGQDFSLIGRPLLQPGLVDVQAIVIEKSLSHTRTVFKFRKRKQYRNINFYRNQTTMLRINSIEIKEPVETRNVKHPGIESIFC